MNHSDVRNHMADYLEGDLPLDRRALFDAHLDECAECSTEIAQMRSTIEALRALPDPEVPAQLSANVMRRIRAGESEQGLLDRIRIGLGFLFEPRVLAPVSAVMLVGGLLIGTGQIRDAVGGLEPATVADPVVAQVGPTLRSTERPLPGAFAVQDDRPRAARAPRNYVVVTPPATAPSRTPGQELVALSELLDEPTAPQTPFNQWPEAAPPRPNVAQSVTVAASSDRRDPSLGQPGSSGGPLAGPSAAAGARAWPSSEEWLTHLQRNPAEFAERLSGRTLAEQELWVQNLARRASEQGNLEDVIASLRASDSRAARLLAEDFEAARPTLEANAQR